jgi:hypothetical protein
VRNLTYTQSGAVTNRQHCIKRERAERRTRRWIGTSDVQQQADLGGLWSTPLAGPAPQRCEGSVLLAPAPSATKAQLRVTIRQERRNAWIEMMPNLGEGTSQQLAIGGMEGRRTCRRPMLQHNRQRLFGELGVPLQEAVEAQEHPRVGVVAESSGAHPFNVIAHQIAEDTAEARRLPYRFQRSVWLRGEQCPQNRFATVYTVPGAQLGDRIAGKSILPVPGSRGID